MGRFDTAYEYKVKEEQYETPKERVKYKDLHSGLMASTTAHGLPHIYYARGWFKTFMWVAFTVIAVGWWLYNTYIIVNSYLKYEANVNIQITSMRSVVFPAVTICNLNPLRRTEVAGNSELYGFIDGSALNGITIPDYDDDYFDEDFDFGDGAFDSASRDSGSTRTEYLAEYLADNGEDFMEPLGHQREDLIQYCTFNGYSCKMNLLSHIYNWYYGNCFTFNSGVNITTGAGSASITNSSNTGPLYGLKLILNVEQDEYLGDLTEQAGVRILVHNQGAMPFPEDEGISAPVGVSTSIAITQHHITRLGEFYGDCVLTSNQQDSINMYEEKYKWSNYTQKACMNTCYQRNLVSECNCSDARYPREGKALNSTAEDLQKLQSCNTTSGPNEKCKAKVTTMFTNGSLPCTSCDRPCKETIYQTSVSSSAWPATRYLPTLTTLLPKIPTITADAAEVKENLVHVEIYYRELNVETLTESPAYDLGQFLSDLGGAIGLWVGASLITVLEYFEWFIDFLVLGCFKCKNKNQQKRPKPSQTPVQDLPKNNRNPSYPGPGNSNYGLDYSQYGGNSGFAAAPPSAVLAD